MKLRIGIAGFGVVGKRRKYYLDQHPNVEVVGVCDQVQANMEGLKDNIKSFSNIKELLKEQLDVLFVCLTNDVAAQSCIDGLNKGLHVFCEKPPGRNISDINKVISVEQKHPHLKLMYGFNHRFHESVQEALQIIKSNELGEIINVRAVYGKAKMTTFNQTDWRTKRSIAGGGILLDQGIHMVDLLRYFVENFRN